jgi:hypothetical protein
MISRLLLLALLLLLCALPAFAAGGGGGNFPPPLDSYADGHIEGIGPKLLHRAKAEPFNLIGSALFLMAIIHTFLVARFRRWAHHYEHEIEALDGEGAEIDDAQHKRVARLRFRATALHFLGEIEAVFGIWLVPLFITMAFFSSFGSAVAYIDGVNFAEPIFVTVIMAMAATRPVIKFAEICLAQIAGLLGGKPAAWWYAILVFGPLLGSFITEPAAMTLCALLLAHRFYEQRPPMALRYATLGLLFCNISVGGTLSHFAAPPVVMVAQKWDLTFAHMFLNFGWKAALAIVISTVLYGIAFRKQLGALAEPQETGRHRPIPLFVTATHLFFLAWTVFNAHHPALVVIGGLFFLAFIAATEPYQEAISLRGPMLVGFFLAALVIHGGCQQWWIEPVLTSLGPWPLMIGSTVLTAFNDNAAITYLASLVPGFSEEMKYAVLAGAVTGGGLTVIANAPNPAGQSLLQHYFGEDGIQPVKLFLAAIVPTFIIGACFMVFR